MPKISFILNICYLLLLIILPAYTFAQDTATVSETQLYEKARVLDVSNERVQPISGTDTPSHIQTLKIEVISGEDIGKTPTFDNESPMQLLVGETFYVRHIHETADNIDRWSVADVYRLNVLIGIAVLFLALLAVFGGTQGARGLLSLIGSVLTIFYILIPLLYHGYSPILVSIVVSLIIITLGSYVTHGWNKTTTVAVCGMFGTVIVTGLIAYYVVHAAQLTGYSSEESVYLNFDTHGHIDMAGLLFGGIMIGLLGVLYDIAIGQAIVVEELLGLGTQLSRRQVYVRALRVGREHIGALVNTLAIAYVGVALPLLLLIQSSTGGILFTLNSEIFATEIVRILIGSIGLVLAVPVTTSIAAYVLPRIPHNPDSATHHGHSHVHH